MAALLIFVAACFIVVCSKSNEQGLANLREAGRKWGMQQGAIQAEALRPLPNADARKRLAAQFPGFSDQPKVKQEAFAEGFVVGFEEGFQQKKAELIGKGVSPDAWKPKPLF